MTSYRKKSVEDIDVQGKRVLVRVDFNVPMDEQGRITDDKRIRASLPTIQYLLRHGARVILMSHLGRPKGKPEPRYSLKPVAHRLEELLSVPVRMLPDCVGDEVEQAVASLPPGHVALLENLRFHPEEEKNDPDFARRLARLGDVYVNDAFGSAHRAHASTEGVAHYLPAVAGFLMLKEIETMGRALAEPERPFVAILGGAKVSDKIGVIRNLMNRVDALLIGGGMAYTFLKARGYEIGDSLLDAEHVDLARELMQEAERRGVRLVLPEDVVVAREFKADAPHQVVPASAIPAGWQGLDIGPRTRERFAQEVARARTVIWNGP
ncbi:MAG TPA: phosphoglycerate kinase, partial [Limnochordales bacterium]